MALTHSKSNVALLLDKRYSNVYQLFNNNTRLHMKHIFDVLFISSLCIFVYLFICSFSHLFIYFLLTWMMAFHTSALWMDFLEYSPQHRRLLNSPPPPPTPPPHPTHPPPPPPPPHPTHPPIATYIRQWIGSALVQVLADRLFGAKDYLNQCWIIVSWTLSNKRQWKSSQNTNFSFTKSIWKWRLWNVGHFVHEKIC